ncbi:MAG TPA: dihydrofolate reductase family protein [Gammaproteobacteria bacterium]|nr:dihydrofolate reductase family protein [Gammaproteobacteria bacterium]
MRRIIVSNLMSLDGFMEGPNGELDWFVVDEEFFGYAREMLGEVDTILFGRTTYQHMAGYWPTPAAAENDPFITEKMNTLPKIVFSKTLQKVEWANSRLAKKALTDEVWELKQQHGKDIVIFGSGSIVSALGQAQLIDEYRLFVNPIILGHGAPMFRQVRDRIRLKLLKTRIFNSGLVGLYYRP